MKNALLAIVVAAVVGCAFAKCNPYTVYVKDDQSLQTALSSARPGARILLYPLAPYYTGPFVISVNATPDCPITIAGLKPGEVTLSSKLDSDCLTLDGASNVVIRDLVIYGVRPLEGDKVVFGMRLLHSNFNLVENVVFHRISGTGVLLTNSSSNTFSGCKFSLIDRVGLATEEDSNNNTITKCTFGDELKFEAVNLYFGCSQNRVVQNTFNGRYCTFTSWIELYGSDNIISGNTFKNPDSVSIDPGIDAFGSGNLFQANTFDLNLDKYCISGESDNNRICASNKALHSAGLTDKEIDKSC